MLKRIQQSKLTIYRRHKGSCENRDIQGCKCPLWVHGKVRGQRVQRSLETRSYAAAEALRDEMIHGVSPDDDPTPGGGLHVIGATPKDEITLAIFIFIGSYCAVIAGCYWWVKAKAWNDAVVFIGLMPLTIFLIPYVRLLVFAVPQVMMAAMVMMPLILVVVVAVLPDKSGLSRRRASWERRRD